MNYVDQVWTIPGGSIRFTIATTDPLPSMLVSDAGRVVELVEKFAALCGYSEPSGSVKGASNDGMYLGEQVEP